MSEAIAEDELPATVLPDPEERKRWAELAPGVPLEIAGKTWILPWALTGTRLDRYRDSIFDLIVIKECYYPDDVLMASLELLTANYDITPEEAGELAANAEWEPFYAAIKLALFGDFPKHKQKPTDKHVKYSAWVRVSLLINHIDPAAILPEDFRLVLQSLVRTGRAEAQKDFISSVEYVVTRPTPPNLNK